MTWQDWQAGSPGFSFRSWCNSRLHGSRCNGRSRDNNLFDKPSFVTRLCPETVNRDKDQSSDRVGTHDEFPGTLAKIRPTNEESVNSQKTGLFQELDLTLLESSHRKKPRKETLRFFVRFAIYEIKYFDSAFQLKIYHQKIVNLVCMSSFQKSFPWEVLCRDIVVKCCSCQFISIVLKSQIRWKKYINISYDLSWIIIITIQDKWNINISRKCCKLMCTWQTY